MKLQPLLVDAKTVAELLCMPVRTVQQYASRNPAHLPPRMNLPGRRLVWSLKDVEAWVEQHRNPQQEQSQPENPQ